MANRLDDAARLLISSLEDPDKRIDALMAVQRYYAHQAHPPWQKEVRPPQLGRPGSGLSDWPRTS